MALHFTLRQLEYLVAVADCGSIALAAERVNVSSPSISTAISQLESGSGLQLFIRRHAQGLSLTESGRQFTSLARDVLASAGRLSDRAADIAGKVAGPLGIGCLSTFAQVVMPHLRRSFTDRFAEVEFHQFEGHQADLFDAIRRGQIDVALTYDLDIPPEVEFLPLVSLAPHALLPVHHPLAAQAQVTPHELAPHPMVLLDLPHSAAYFLSLFSAAGVQPNIVERTRDMGVMRAMVANGFGYSIANIRFGTDRAPDGKQLITVPLHSQIAPLDIGLALPRMRTERRALSAFVAHCRQMVPLLANADHGPERTGD